jgi:2-polyprenyl-6-methoxyphenol hydroxylase-like FAD-dependent oxidoreductase
MECMQILESASNLGEVGAAVNIPPNARRMLESWGVHAEREGAMVVKGFRFYNGQAKKIHQVMLQKEADGMELVRRLTTGIWVRVHVLIQGCPCS